jgi:hypothetical protein
MSQALPQPTDLLQHLWSMCDGTASDAELAQLEQWAASDVAIRRMYLQFVAMHVELQWTTRGDQAADAAIAQLPFLIGLKDSAFQPTPLTTLLSRWRRKCASPVAVTAALACLLYGVFVCLAWNLRPEQPLIDSVMTVQSAKSTRQLPPATPEAIVRHAPGKIHVGTSPQNIQFAGGVQAKLDSHTEFDLVNEKLGYLHRGHLDITLPQGGGAFSVITPTATIVDRGTEFGTTVDEAGGTSVEVRRGKVEVTPRNDGILISGNQQAFGKLTLVAGESVRVLSRRENLGKRGIGIRSGPAASAKSFGQSGKASPHDPARRIVAYEAPLKTSYIQGVPIPLGLDFIVIEPIVVYRLGAFDYLGDGFHDATKIMVELWSRDDAGTPYEPRDDGPGKLLAITVFTHNSPGELVGGNRLNALDQPVELTPGSYTIVARGFNREDPNGNLAGDSAETSPWTTNAGDDQLQFVGLARHGEISDSFPKFCDRGPANRYAAGTFEFGSSPATTGPTGTQRKKEQNTSP